MPLVREYSIRLLRDDPRGVQVLVMVRAALLVEHAEVVAQLLGVSSGLGLLFLHHQHFFGWSVNAPIQDKKTNSSMRAPIRLGILAGSLHWYSSWSM